MRLGRVRHGERILKDSETHHPRFRPLCYASHADVLTASEVWRAAATKARICTCIRADLGIPPQLPPGTHERIPAASQLQELRERQSFEARSTSHQRR